MEKVSIIVPVYNTEKYLKKCLDSLINQTLKDIEIIIISDGSPDNSESVIKNYNDPRIKYYNEKHSGIGATRNFGIKKAKGEYISFIDSDDYVTPNFCETMYNKAVQDKCDLIVSNFFYDKEKKIERYNIIPFLDTTLEDNPKLLYYLNLGPCNKIYKRDLLIKNKIYFDEKLKYEDAPFVCKSLKYAKKIGKVEDYLSYYVIHNNSETTTRDERVFDIFKITDIIKSNFDNNIKMQEYVNKTIIRIIIDYMVQQRYQIEFNTSKKFINKAYTYLNKLDENWKKNNFFNTYGFVKSTIVKNKILLLLYIKMYKIVHK